jgi:hypothetical protein
MLKSGLSKIDTENVYVGTSSDVLSVAENYKDTLSNQDYNNRLETLQLPNVYWAELDKETFLENVFKNDEYDNHETVIDDFVKNSHISPLYTCNYISLKPNEGSCFWDSTLFDEVFESLL